MGWRIAKTSSNNNSANPCTKRIAKIEKPDIDGRGRIGVIRRFCFIYDKPLEGGKQTQDIDGLSLFGCWTFQYYWSPWRKAGFWRDRI